MNDMDMNDLVAVFSEALFYTGMAQGILSTTHPEHRVITGLDLVAEVLEAMILELLKREEKDDGQNQISE